MQFQDYSRPICCLRCGAHLEPCLVFSHPCSKAWPHHERAVSTWLCLQNTWVSCPMCIQSIEECCPSMLFSVCLLCEIPMLFIALSASPNSLTSFSRYVNFLAFTDSKRFLATPALFSTSPNRQCRISWPWTSTSWPWDDNAAVGLCSKHSRLAAHGLFKRLRQQANCFRRRG